MLGSQLFHAPPRQVPTTVTPLAKAVVLQQPVIVSHGRLSPSKATATLRPMSSYASVMEELPGEATQGLGLALGRCNSFAADLVCHSPTSSQIFSMPKAVSSFRMPDGQDRRGREFQSPSRRGATPRIDVASLDVASLTKPPPELPAKLAEDYEDTEPLGEGAFAIVRRLRKKQDGGLVALKVVEKYPLHIRNMIPQLQREVRIQGSLQHRHILRLLSCIEDEWYLYMLLEHCPGGSLRELCARQPDCRISEAKGSWYFAQILQGVDYMHQKHYVHRDLKEENMLLTSDDEVRICDFGWSAEVQVEKALRTTCGTPHYWPPEIFEGDDQDTPVDLWALGTLVYELLVGHAPFWGTVEEIRRKVMAVDLRYPPKLLSKEAIQLFYFLLRRDPLSRTPANQLLEENAWVRQGLDAFAKGHSAPRIGASMVDSTVSRPKAAQVPQVPVVAPIIMPGSAQCQVPLSAALPKARLWNQEAMGLEARSAVLRPTVRAPAKVALISVVPATLRFGTAR